MLRYEAFNHNNQSFVFDKTRQRNSNSLSIRLWLYRFHNEVVISELWFYFLCLNRPKVGHDDKLLRLQINSQRFFRFSILLNNRLQRFNWMLLKFANEILWRITVKSPIPVFGPVICRFCWLSDIWLVWTVLRKFTLSNHWLNFVFKSQSWIFVAFLELALRWLVFRKIFYRWWSDKRFSGIIWSNRLRIDIGVV